MSRLRVGANVIARHAANRRNQWTQFSGVDQLAASFANIAGAAHPDAHSGLCAAALTATALAPSAHAAQGLDSVAVTNPVTIANPADIGNAAVEQGNAGAFGACQGGDNAEMVAAPETADE